LPSVVGKFKDSPEATPPGEIQAHELWSHWRKGLQAIAKRAEDEHWKDDHEIQLYFLSKPAKINRTVKGPMQIPPGYGTTIYELLTRDDLTRHSNG